MGNIDGRAAIEALSGNVLDARFEDFDQATIDNAKNRIMDVIGCAIGGANAPGNAALIELVEDWGGKKEATILAHGVKAPAPTAAMVNCIMCRSFDFEPVIVCVRGMMYPGHMSGTTGLTSVTLGESRGISGKELITAMVVGDDVCSRLAGAVNQPWDACMEHRLKPLTSQIVPWGTLAAFGATAIAGRLLGLNQLQMRNAFGIVINMLSGAGGSTWEGTSLFKLSQGTSARNGIIAAELAKRGWIGIEDALFGLAGYFPVFTNGCDDPEILTRDLGKKYYVELVCKPYPGGRPTHLPIDAALALVHKNDINVDDIEDVALHLSRPAKYGHYMKPYKVGDYPIGDALFSYKYSVATALLRKSVKCENFTEESIRDPKVQALIGKIKLADLDKPEGVELELKMKDGRTLYEYVRVATGDIPNTLSRDALIAKFMSQVEFSETVSKQNAEKLLGLLERLEEVDNVNKIVGLAVRN